MKFTKFLLANPRLIAREGEGASGAGDTSAADAAAAAADTGNKNKGTADELKFSQNNVDEIVVKRNKAVKQQLETAEATVEKLLATQNLSVQERAELETQLGDLQSQMRTKEQQAAHEAARAAAEYSAKLEETSGERDLYKTRFETMTRDNAILKAAGEADAYNPQQFVDTLGPRTRIVEELNGEGVKTGRLVPRVEVTEAGEDGAPKVVLKTPKEAIAAMKEDVDRFGNLFRGNVAKGIGEGTNNTFTGKSHVDVTKMSDAEYFANRDQFKDQIGLRDKRV